MSAHSTVIPMTIRPRMSRGDRRRWRATRSLADVAALTALWLEGAVASQPNYQPNYGPDEETVPLVPMLAAWNRAGFLTDGSQPGDLEECAVLGTLGRQRAAVDGFIDRYTGSRIMAAAIEAGLWVVVDGVTVHGEPFIADGECWARSSPRWTASRTPGSVPISAATGVALCTNGVGVPLKRRSVRHCGWR